jgi:hypothetical protein
MCIELGWGVDILLYIVDDFWNEFSKLLFLSLRYIEIFCELLFKILLLKLIPGGISFAVKLFYLELSFNYKNPELLFYTATFSG